MFVCTIIKVGKLIYQRLTINMAKMVRFEKRNGVRCREASNRRKADHFKEGRSFQGSIFTEDQIE